MKSDLLVKMALEEDIPSGDVTTDHLPLKSKQITARLVAKQDLILSGTELFEKTFLSLDSKIQIKWQFRNSGQVLKGQIVAMMEGDAAEMLKGERVALNFLGHLSGIATLTNAFVKNTEGSKTKILDTRKTTPLLRHWVKRAVVDGGGTNHRMNLSDAILIKDNHIQACGGIKNAVEHIRKSSGLPIEVEAQTLDQVKEAMGLKVSRILLDNMSFTDLAEALKLIPPSIETEATGNMTLDRIAKVAKLNPTYISVGAITHSAPNADFSLQFDWSH